MTRTGKVVGDDDAEWKRVLQNPDNMIVSDSLRDQVASILTNRSESLDFVAEILVGSDSLFLEVSHISRERDKTTISGTCLKQAVKPILPQEMSSWSETNVRCGEELLFTVSLVDQQLEVSYDMSSSAGLCFVTLTCASPSPVSKKRVL